MLISFYNKWPIAGRVYILFILRFNRANCNSDFRSALASVQYTVTTSCTIRRHTGMLVRQTNEELIVCGRNTNAAAGRAGAGAYQQRYKKPPGCGLAPAAPFLPSRHFPTRTAIFPP